MIPYFWAANAYSGLTVEPGKIGETIQVKNPSSGKLIRGVVVDERTVRIN